MQPQGAGSEARRWKIVAAGAFAALVLALVALAWSVGAFGDGPGDGEQGSTTIDPPATEPAPPEHTDTDAETDTDETATGLDASDALDLADEIDAGAGLSEDIADPPDARPQLAAQIPLTVADELEGARRASGTAGIVKRGSAQQLVVQAKLPKNRRKQAYEVWLYNSDSDARSLGAQVTDRRGRFLGGATLPEDFSRYRFIDVSREPVTGPKAHSGDSILRGRLKGVESP